MKPNEPVNQGQATAAGLTLRDPAPMRAPELTVIVPTFNERANVAGLVERFPTTLVGIAWEVIFVDDDSPDGTSALVKEIGARDHRIRCIRRVGRRGLAGACIEGMLASHASYIAVMDGDLQHDETLLPQMLTLLRTGQADIVIGSRYVGGQAVDGFSRTRHAGSMLANSIANRLFGLDISDPLSGFFMTKRDIVEEIAPRLSTQGFKILLDILISTHETPRVLELPYSFRLRQEGTSKLDNRIVLDFAGLLISKATRDLIPIRFATFLLVGTSGVLVHLICLKAALTVLGLSFPVAQTLATIAAMTSNFFMNNSLTYRDQCLHGIKALKGLVLFFVICSLGAVSNIGVASWIYVNEPIWWVAGLAGSLMSAIWNYVMSSAFVWRARN
jgi:dolichol-phosphate mannosyltransferase